jgi:hypothetical protein
VASWVYLPSVGSLGIVRLGIVLAGNGFASSVPNDAIPNDVIQAFAWLERALIH